MPIFRKAFFIVIFLLFCSTIHSSNDDNEEGSASGELVGDEWVEYVLNNFTNPHYLLQQVYFTLGETKPFVDNEEIIALERSYPNVIGEEFKANIFGMGDPRTLKERIELLQRVVFYAFKPFGCTQENFWPNVYMLSEANLQCLAENLIEDIYHCSEFTRKYFARAIYFGLNSKAPIEHRTSEMSIYQFLLPKREHAWFKDLKSRFKNSFWNEQELSRIESYFTNSFQCGSIPFWPQIQSKINEQT